MNAGLISNNQPPRQESFDWQALVKPQGNEPGADSREIAERREDNQLDAARTNAVLQYLDRLSTQAQSAPAQFKQNLSYKF